MKKIVSISLIVLLTLGLVVSAGGTFAADQVEEISAYINRNISMTWDGEDFEPMESDGSRLHPIIYDGRTYLPAKYVADKAGVDVDWDPDTQTVFFTSDVINVDLAEPYKDAQPIVESDERVVKLGFYKFDLEIESDDDDELEVEFEVYRSGQMQAEVEIEVGDRKELELEGQAALDYLLPILENLDIDASMSRQQIVDRVIEAFDWNYGYDEFELEVKFSDGNHIDFEMD